MDDSQRWFIPCTAIGGISGLALAGYMASEGKMEIPYVILTFILAAYVIAGTAFGFSIMARKFGFFPTGLRRAWHEGLSTFVGTLIVRYLELIFILFISEFAGVFYLYPKAVVTFFKERH